MTKASEWSSERHRCERKKNAEKKREPEGYIVCVCDRVKRTMRKL